MGKGRRGVTLVEVMLAGAITALVVLAVMRGVIVAVKVCHENSTLLAAEAYAWDTAWNWLNKKDDDLNDTSTTVFYPNADGFDVESNACPAIYHSGVGGAAKCYVSVQGVTWTSGTDTMRAKRINVNVEWGPPGDRRCLWTNRVASATVKSYNVPITVFKSSIDRGE